MLTVCIVSKFQNPHSIINSLGDVKSRIRCLISIISQDQLKCMDIIQILFTNYFVSLLFKLPRPGWILHFSIFSANCLLNENFCSPSFPSASRNFSSTSGSSPVSRASVIFSCPSIKVSSFIFGNLSKITGRWESPQFWRQRRTRWVEQVDIFWKDKASTNANVKVFKVLGMDIGPLGRIDFHSTSGSNCSKMEYKFGAELKTCCKFRTKGLNTSRRVSFGSESGNGVGMEALQYWLPDAGWPVARIFKK